MTSERSERSGAEDAQRDIPAGAVAPPAAGATRLWAWGLLLGSGIVWGVTFSLARIAAQGGAHPLGITLWQGIFGGALLPPLVLPRRGTIAADRAEQAVLSRREGPLAAASSFPRGPLGSTSGMRPAIDA